MSPDIFDKLTEPQMRVIEHLSISVSYSGAKATMDELEKLGLIAYQEYSKGNRFGKFTWRKAYMPLSAHMAWCEWCSRGVTAFLPQRGTMSKENASE